MRRKLALLVIGFLLPTAAYAGDNDDDGIVCDRFSVCFICNDGTCLLPLPGLPDLPLPDLPL